MKVDQITFFPHRKGVGILGFSVLIPDLFLFYRFFESGQVLYVVLALVVAVIAIYLLGPFFRNAVVDIIDNIIILHSFWNKYELSFENLDTIVHHKDGGISYQFSVDDGLFQITPKGYQNGEEMQVIFDNIYAKKNLHSRRSSR